MCGAPSGEKGCRQPQGTRESEGEAEVSRSQPADQEEARESVPPLAAEAEEGLMWRDNTAGSPGGLGGGGGWERGSRGRGRT